MGSEATDREVDVVDLVVKNRVSKPLDEYTLSTRNVAALERAESRGVTRSPGQDVEYVVVDSKQSSDRVAFASEGLDEFDVEFYRRQLLRAVERVLSPLGCGRWRLSSTPPTTRMSHCTHSEF